MPRGKEPVLTTATSWITRSSTQLQLEQDDIIETQQQANYDDDLIWGRIPPPRVTYARQAKSQLVSKMIVNTNENRCTPLDPTNQLATKKYSSHYATSTPAPAPAPVPVPAPTPPIPDQTLPTVNDLENADDVGGLDDIGDADDVGGLDDFDFEFALVQDEDVVMQDNEKGEGREKVQELVKQSNILYDPQSSSKELVITLGDS
ncbi:MAG: hypothetical protein MMC33_010540 [Icmadophila ericetorum]|nr:hypothetical protein [Icmadophila ericetorum]